MGKTCLLHKFTKNTFNHQYKCTIGADFLTKELMLYNWNVTLQIWDTAGILPILFHFFFFFFFKTKYIYLLFVGQERFSSLSPAFYRGSDICILVVDLTSTKTIISLSKWQKTTLTELSLTENEFPFIVAGCKADLIETGLESRSEIESNEALTKSWAATFKYPYFRVRYHH